MLVEAQTIRVEAVLEDLERLTAQRLAAAQLQNLV
jgi:hypothetical protein